MKYKSTRKFQEDYQKLTPELKEKAKKVFRLFQDNPRHPSLQTHSIRGTKNPKIFEGYVDRNSGYRFTFHYEEDTVVFRRIGPHKIIDKEARG
jgi:mRNA-degrading endonuclease YafQ of YafQ-DinJ toxin-antitoxin module